MKPLSNSRQFYSNFTAWLLDCCKLKEVIELASYFISIRGTNSLKSYSHFVRLEYALTENILKAEVITF